MRFKQLFLNKEAKYKVIFDELFDYSTNFVWQMVKNKDDTEDIVQNSFIKLFKRFDQFNQKSTLKTYFTRILINTCLDHFKKKKLTVVDIDLIQNKSEDKKTSSINLDDSLAKLSPQHRICLSLYYYENMSIKEISEMTELSLGTIKSHLSRGRDELKKHLDKTYGQ